MILKTLYKKVSKIIFRRYFSWLIDDIQKEAFIGNNNYCPCCKSNLITFLPYGLPKRQNALCPVCQAVERHRLIWMFLETQTNIFTQKGRLLHLAPETIFFRNFRQFPNIDYYPVDKFPSSFPKGTIQMEIENLKYGDNFFETIICSFVLEYTADDLIATRELFRVLKPGGWAIIHTFLDKNLKKTIESKRIDDDKTKEVVGNYSSIRMYGLDFKSRLEKAGFSVSCVQYSESFSNEDKFKYGLLDEDIYLCTKHLKDSHLTNNEYSS